jgi:hypothetical protein
MIHISETADYKAERHVPRPQTQASKEVLEKIENYEKAQKAEVPVGNYLFSLQECASAGTVPSAKERQLQRLHRELSHARTNADYHLAQAAYSQERANKYEKAINLITLHPGSEVFLELLELGVL